MNLQKKQAAFSLLVAKLILKAYELGFEVTLGEAYRPQLTADLYAKSGQGIAHTNHLIRLAIDLNLFKDGKFLAQTAHHEALGVWWEAQGTPDLKTCWGGRFNDGNHYSLEHLGVR